jgi:DNA gyrase subunit B
MLSERAKKQWKDPAYKEYMTAKFLEFYRTNDAYRKKSNRLLNEEQRRYWSNFENRKKQSGRVERFFSEHPERREWLSRIAQEQWSSDDLRQWRAAETRKQWTKEFRAKRKQSYNQTYLNKALRVLSDVYRKTGVVDEDQYNTFRRKSGDRSIIRLDTIKERFFDNDDQRFLEAVQHYNHRVMRVKKIPQRVDVYDLEISGTHNFALASGVFVHNSGKMGRDRRTQAVLPLRGKILNIERARLDRMLGSEQIKNIVVALGTAIGDVFNVEKLRYHKLIIATDADVDGAHIRTLLLTLFYRHFRPVIDGGFLYIAQPPLYKIKKGKEVAYAFTDAERVKLIGKEVPIEDTASEEEPAEDEAAEEAPTKAKKAPKITVQRYKGLGEMNPEELWETTMDPARRILKQVTIEDAQEADNIFDMLMGTDVPARKSFIQSHAKEATLDI